MPNGRRQDPFEAIAERIRRQQRDPFGRAALPLGASGPGEGRILSSPVAASPAARPSAVAPQVAPSLAAPRAASSEAQPMARVPQLGAPAPARGSRWKNALGLALATLADAMAARAGRRGQSVLGLQTQIAGRESRESERAQQKVLREYRNKMKQFEFEQEQVRRRFAKEEKMEEREYRKGEKETEFQRMMKLAGLGTGGVAEAPPEGTVKRMRFEEGEVRNRKEFKENLRTMSIGDLTTPGSEARDALLAKAEDLGMSREETEAAIRSAALSKRAAARQREEMQRSGRWRLWAGEPWEKVRGGR